MTIGFIMILVLMGGCTEKKENKVPIRNHEDIVIGSRNYASSVASSYVLKHALLSKGYRATVEVKGEENLWDSLENNKVNIVNSMWFYDVDYSDYKNIQNKVVDLGANSAFYHRGLVVPSYVTTADIDELNFYKYEFDGIIYCLDESDYLIELTREVNESYGLDFELQKVSADELEKILDKAFVEKKWIVLAGYSPHYLLDKYSLRFLVDGNDVFGSKQEIHTIVNTEFIVRNEELKEFIDSFYLYEHEMNSLLNVIENNKDKPISETVSNWIKNHPDIIKRCDGSRINKG